MTTQPVVVDNTTRTCVKCNVAYPHTFEYFAKHKRTCRKCLNGETRAYFQANPDYHKRWRETHREQAKEKSRRWREKNPDRKQNPARVRESHLLNRYGLTQAEYDQLVQQQEGVCAICRRPPNKRGLVVDHDHKTGAVRGALCTNCNHAIGLFYENTAALKKAIEYLEGASE